MSATCEEIARQVIARNASERGLQLVAKFVSERYMELGGKVRFRHLRKLGQIYIPAPIGGVDPNTGNNAAGTVTVTQDSPVVTPDATAIAFWNGFAGSPDIFRGQFFRLYAGRVWLRINEWRPDTNELILETPVAKDNGQVFQSSTTVTGNNYYIVPRYFRTDPSARRLGVFVADYMYQPLGVLSQDELAFTYPSRWQVSAYPWVVSELGSDMDQTTTSLEGNPQERPKLIELYPWPQGSTTLHYTYYLTPPALGFRDMIPPVIDPDVLRTGAEADWAGYMASLCANPRNQEFNLEAAGFWRNVKNQNETVWRSLTGRAAMNDRGFKDDFRFVVASKTWRRPVRDFDPVQTAYQNYVARGY